MASPKITSFPYPAQAPDQSTNHLRKCPGATCPIFWRPRLEIDRLKANLAEAEDSVKSRLEAGAEVERTHYDILPMLVNIS